MAQTRPQDTLDRLCEGFPSFADWWAKEEAPSEDGLVDGVYYEWTHHRVVAEFLTYFSANPAQFTPKQLKWLGDWINDAVSAGGDLESAVSTCFLEHMRQVGINRVLAPYLSRQAKVRSHA
ncbi:MAG: hypothetical protein ACREOU_09225 [Candidatus Eiseniibacteriota bacterium]